MDYQNIFFLLHAGKVTEKNVTNQRPENVVTKANVSDFQWKRIRPVIMLKWSVFHMTSSPFLWNKFFKFLFIACRFWFWDKWYCHQVAYWNTLWSILWLKYIWAVCMVRQLIRILKMWQKDKLRLICIHGTEKTENNHFGKEYCRVHHWVSELILILWPIWT